MVTGSDIALLRRLSGLTQRALAKAMHFSYSTMCALERGDRYLDYQRAMDIVYRIRELDDDRRHQLHKTYESMGLRSHRNGRHK
jgi:DNA-binding XRE family transcriptional regulator